MSPTVAAWQAAALPSNEAQRLARLRRLGLLDTAAEAVVDGYTELAASITGLPMALVSLVEEDRQWFKSAVGVPQGAQTPREVSFCAHAILHRDFFEVEDARLDPRFAGNPLVLGDAGVVHYAGAPLLMPEGEAIGTLCVFASRPGRLPPEQRRLLTQLAASLVQVLLVREQEALLQSEQSMSEAVRLAELAPVGMFSADAGGSVLHGNRQWVKLLGATSLDDLRGQGWQTRVLLDDLPAVQASWRQAVRDRADCQGLFRCHPQDAEAARWLRFRMQPVESRGTPVAYVGVMTDSTEAVWLQEELYRKNRLLARALEAANLGLWEYDRAAGDVHLSGGWTQLLGLGGKSWKMRARSTASFFPQHELPRIAAARRKLLRGEEPRLSLEHQMIDARGQMMWVLTEAQVSQRDASGKVLQVVGTSKDITERVHADAELRTAMRAADEASSAKSDFLATMSHEIRTPLNGVIGLTQLLREASLPPMESDSVAMLDSCAKSLLSLVDNILDFSKIEAGRLTLEEVPTQLPELVHQLSDVFTVRASEKGIRFDLQQEPGLPQWVLVDPTRLRQVLLNLLGNALKFTERGSFGLRVAATGSGDQATLAFAVHDTGPGISESDQERLFTRFTQAEPAAGHRPPGTGLGLAIARQLSQLMGGDVTLVSKQGLGSRFQLEIPLRTCAAPSAVVNTTTNRSTRTGARVLLAEDNEVNQLVATRLLAALGFNEVTVVANGREAVQSCSATAYDLVLMDCQMPVLDGWQATRELRRMGFQAPVLAFTASATLGDRERCLAAGMNDYLSKPIEKSVLAEKLHRWLAEGATDPADVAPEPHRERAVAFDADVIERFFLGDTDMFVQARELFLRQAEKSFDELASAGSDALAGTLHRVRGTAATLGAIQLSNLCEYLERAPMPEARQRLQAELQAFAAASEHIRRTLAPRGRQIA